MTFRMMMACLFFSLFFCKACSDGDDISFGDKTDGDETDSDGTTDGDGEEDMVDCLSLDEDECEAASETCQAYYGTLKRVRNLDCLEPATDSSYRFVACSPLVDESCDTLLMDGQGPDCSIWEFPDSCMPQGWVNLFEHEETDPECDALPTCETCSELDEEACEAASDRCVIERGCPYQLRNGDCLESMIDEDDPYAVYNQEISFITCADPEYRQQGCSDVTEAGLGPDCSIWIFPSTCIPEGWNISEDRDDCAALPACE